MHPLGIWIPTEMDSEIKAIQHVPVSLAKDLSPTLQTATTTIPLDILMLLKNVMVQMMIVMAQRMRMIPSMLCFGIKM